VRFNRVLAIARKNLRSLKHDKRTAGFLVLMPLFMITIFGYTFGGNVKNISVDIVNLDLAPANESLSLLIVDDIGLHETLSIEHSHQPGQAGDSQVATSRERVKDADIWAAIVFAPDFTEKANAALEALRNGTTVIPSALTIYIDGTNPNIVAAIVNEIQRSVQVVLVTSGTSLVPPIVVVPSLEYGQGAEFIDFFAPGVMGLAAMMVTFMLSIISFVHERASFTLDRLLSTPVTEGEIVAGYALAFGIVGLIQSVVILSTAVLLFDIVIEGNILLVLLIIFIFGVGNQGLGFLLSSIAKNEFQAIQFMPIVLFPSILLAGVFWPLEAVPELLRPISYFIPLTYSVDGLRSVMIRGWGLDQVWPEVTILVVFAAVMLGLSILGLKRRR
jgi:ABC-2 type transport system permease protein